MAVTFYMHDNKVVGFQNKVVSAPTITLPPTLDSVTPGDTTNTVAWTPPAGSPDSYNLYWSLTSPVTTGSNKLTGVTSPYVHTGRTNGTPYYYAVTAVKGGLESALSNEGSGTPAWAGLLDLLSVTALLAVSNFQRRNAYAGAILRARDAAGNEQDIGVDANRYFDAAAWTAFGGVYVPKWYDQAPTPHDPTQAVVATMPKGNLAAINSLFGINGYDAGERYLLTPSFNFNQAFTVLLVEKSLASNYRGWMAQNGSAWGCNISAATKYQGYAGTYSNSTPAVDTSAHLLEWQFNGASSVLNKDGVAVAMSTGDWGAGNHTGGVKVGAEMGYSMNGVLCEAYIFAGLLSTADRAVIKTYLGTPYGITLP